ncbi:glycosyltransferase [Dactylosporangium siamense]|uniref:Glycosyl transferase family 1 domain-containing protein n=1 Tax=Dactylosporangium siamense TaxID=685454 RepID=A0A919UCD9_9ACTN|nr:glycosyltransferase [Dactylosporangium siamense]GIG50262.1 hypothetical protein Dsi01nite_083030 [Dactylosporangium siamense]
MKVVVIHNLTAGGAHRRLTEQVAALDADVVEVTTTHAEPVTARPYLVPLHLRAPRLPSVARPPARYLDLRRLVAAWAEIGALTRRIGADVVYANPDSVLRGAMPCGPLPFPVLRYCDEPRRIDYEPALRATRRAGTRGLYAVLHRQQRRLDRAALADSSAVATNSRYTAGQIRRAYGRTADVVPCGVPSFMAPGPSAAAHHLLSVGAMIASKGHDLVIQAAALCRLQLPVIVVAHRGDAIEEQRLHTLARGSGVPLQIKIGVSDQELVVLYQNAFATLYLAAAEPLGLVSLEAQACGSPVVVATEGGLPETLRDGVTGFAVARDPEAAAQALNYLADGVRRNRIVQAAARHGASVSWADCTKTLHRALTSLAETAAEQRTVLK